MINKKNPVLLIAILIALAIAASCKPTLPPPPAVAPEGWGDTVEYEVPQPKAETPPAPVPRAEVPPEPPVIEIPPPLPPARITTPELRITFSPRYFNPIEDRSGLSIFMSAVDEVPIKSWKIEIREPQPPYLLFYAWEGEGRPPERLNWNGISYKNELVQSASDYPVTFSAMNTTGNTGIAEAYIEVDVFYTREGENLRIQIPSIVFDSNSGGWDNQNMVVVNNNDNILRRIAQILRKFDTYRVQVEGHANPTVHPGDSGGRRREEILELQPLSERRARAIVDYLAELGIDEERLSYSGLGGQRPVVSWEDRDSWWKNRRLEFLLIK